MYQEGKTQEENDWSSVKTVKSKFTLKFTGCVKYTAIEIPYEALENDELDLLPSPFYAQIYLKKLHGLWD